MIVTTAIIAKKTTDILISYFAKRGLDKIFNNKEDLKTRLYIIINKSLDEYEKQYPINDINGKYAFYKSQKIINELLQYRVMKDEYNVSNLYEAFDSEINVIPPTKENIERFYDIFISNINADDKIKGLEISQTFEAEIFNISRKLDAIRGYIESILNQIDTQLEAEWKRQIDVYKENINNLKPKTALDLLSKLESSFETCDKKPSLQIIATINYLKAQCFELLEQKDEAFKAYITAYKQNPSIKIFKEQACISYAKISDIKQSNILIEELLSEDGYNPVAWAIKYKISDNIDLDTFMEQVPAFTTRDCIFKRNMYFFISESQKDSLIIDDLKKHNIIPLESDYNDSKLSINNYREKIFWIESKLSEYFSNTYYTVEKINITNSDLLIFIEKISSKFLESLSDSEFHNKFDVLRFYNHYAQFALKGDRDHVLEMKLLYSKLKSKDNSLCLILSNALQIIGEVKSALEIIDEIKTIRVDLLYIKAFCCLKINDFEKYVKTIKLLLSHIKDINLDTIEYLLSSAFILSSLNRMDVFSENEFIEEKEFTFPCLKSLLTIFVRVLKNENDPSLKSNLLEIENDILIKGRNLIFYVPYAYFILKEYDSAINFFRKYISKDKESRDLYFYIMSLDKSNANSEELLQLLEYWRKTFSFNEELLRVEVDLRRQLSDWEKCLEISEFYFQKNGVEESFLTMELIATDQLEREYKAKRIDEIANIFSDFRFKVFGHASIVSSILIRYGYNEIAIEILYKQVIEKNDAKARMAYFTAMVNIPENIANEKEIVEVGCWVKYSHNGKLNYIEVKGDNTMSQKILGHKKGDIIDITKTYSKSTETITIERIMDKYLCLHDQIVDDVSINPLSELPMESIKLKDSTIEGINETFVSLMGENGIHEQEAKNIALNKYYRYELSLSELIIQIYTSDYIGGYYNLISQKDGIAQIPLSLYPSNIFDKEKEYVLDLSALLIIFQIYREHKVSFSHKFIIPKGIIDLVRDCLKKEQQAPDEQMFVNIIGDKVVPSLKSKETKQNNIAYFENILTWINLNCIETLVEKKLDIIRQSKSDVQNDKIFEISIEAILLILEIENRILITDDLFYLKFFPLQSRKLISSELYLKNTLGNENNYMNEFIKNRYIGYSLSPENLLDEFNKKISGEPNMYSDCLKNISLKFIRQSQVVFTTAKFLKEITQITSLKNEQIVTESEIVLASLLKDITDDSAFQLTYLAIYNELKEEEMNLSLIMEGFENAISKLLMQ